MKSMLAGAIAIVLSVGALAAGLVRVASAAEMPNGLGWNPQSAAAYLDQRANWWMAWPVAQRDHSTFCISCHTAVPYLLARPGLRTALGEKGPSGSERRMLEDVIQRVRIWDKAEPFYSGGTKTLESRATESVLDALILAAVDLRNGELSNDTRAAFHHMWALQDATGDQKGAWPWLDFGNEPFEATESVYYGASLAAVAVGMAPDNYRRTPDIQDRLKLLGNYIRRESERQPLIHQVVALWAATMWPGLLPDSLQNAIIDNVFAQQQSDGGWGLSSMGWTWRGSGLRTLVNLWVRSNDIPLAGKSDGYATGLIVFVLEQAGFQPDEVHLQRGRAWLLANQNRGGVWPGYSMVNRRDHASGTGLFMSDAATSYAVLALTANSAHKVR